MRVPAKPVARFVRELIYGAEPIGAGDAVALAQGNARELSGRMGFVHYGINGDPATSFAGYVSSPQVFQGPAQLGSITDPPVQDYPALPSDVSPPGLAYLSMDPTAGITS